MNFEEARRACRSDGGELLSIESEAEQQLIQNFIHDLRAADGDFWIGLRRDKGYEETSGDCPSQYYWLDGSQSTFRSGFKTGCLMKFAIIAMAINLMAVHRHRSIGAISSVFQTSRPFENFF